MGVTLAMIVRDEAHCVARAIRSARPHVDSWVVIDTGSRDGTLEIALRSLSGLPGRAFSREWVDFGHNRSELVALAREHFPGGHLLLLDADMELKVGPGALEALDADAYMLPYEGPLAWSQMLLVKAALPWRYVGATHEYITCDSDVEAFTLPGASIVHHGDGGHRAEKFERDLALLQREALERPDDPRTAFYLAQTYRDVGQGDDAWGWYQRRAAMGGWAEEVYVSLLEAGRLQAAAGQWPEACQDYMKALDARPRRLEAAYELSAGLRTRGMMRAAHAFASLAPLPVPVPEGALFASPAVYEWGMAFEHGITAWHAGDYRGSADSLAAVLACGTLPNLHRAQAERNLALAVQSLA